MKKIYLFFCILISISNSLIAQPKLYPSHWWVGMKHTTLQIMVHEKEIGTKKVAMKPYAGVKLVKSYSPEHKNSYFIDLTISTSV
ncbi:MAG: cyclomaltodextrinase N-terminal domain-containing protein, partial [Sphingobacteriales bacterium]